MRRKRAQRNTNMAVGFVLLTLAMLAFPVGYLSDAVIEAVLSLSSFIGGTAFIIFRDRSCLPLWFRFEKSRR
jgi:hypothetical protein